MKKLLLVLAIVLLASPLYAQTLSWDAVPNAEGYRISYKVLADTSYNQVDNGTATTFDLSNSIPGTRYEIYVEAYAGTPPSYSGQSDHLRWTMPTPPQIVELPPDQKIILEIRGQ